MAIFNVDIGKLIHQIESDLSSVTTTANAAMPKSGGTFTGDVVAVNTNRANASLRNIEVRITDTTGELQSTDKIVFVRK